MANPTPGPWTIWRLSATDGALVVGKSGPNGPERHVANICWGRDEIDERTGASGLGDARLISAAPEGFDLIEQLEESFTADGTYQQFLPAMRAYLAKAKGVAA